MKWFSGLFKQCIDVNRFPLKKKKKKRQFWLLILLEAVISLFPSIFLSMELKCISCIFSGRLLQGALP